MDLNIQSLANLKKWSRQSRCGLSSAKHNMPTAMSHYDFMIYKTSKSVLIHGKERMEEWKGKKSGREGGRVIPYKRTTNISYSRYLNFQNKVRDSPHPAYWICVVICFQIVDIGRGQK